jgi:hypothetical protein
MKVKGTSELSYELYDIDDYYSGYLMYDGEKNKLITPDNIPEDYDEFLKGAISKYLEKKDYGSDIEDIYVILICRPGGSKFKIRKRYRVSNKGKKGIGIDCILDYGKTHLMRGNEEKIYLLQELKKTFTSIQTYKKKLKNFDFDAFENDIQAFLDAEITRIENES